MAKLEDIRYRHERGTTPRPDDVEFLLAKLEAVEAKNESLKELMADAWEVLIRPSYPPASEPSRGESEVIQRFLDPIDERLRARIMADMEKEVGRERNAPD